jgi:hypothetical protein
MNAVKHGLTAKYIVIGGEDPDEFEALRTDLELEFDPSTRLGLELIDLAAGYLWRLRRGARLEASLMKGYQAEASAEAEAQRESEHSQSISDEAERRCAESFGNDEETILRSRVDGTYSRRYYEFLGEVETETKPGWKPPTQEQNGADSEQERESGLLRLIRDVDSGDALGRLIRYEAALMKGLNQTLQHLHRLQAERNATKVISV